MTEHPDLDQFYDFIREIYVAVMLDEIGRSPEGIIREMTFHEVHAVEAIRDNPGVTIAGLARLINTTDSGMATMMEGLVDRGLVKRSGSNSDRGEAAVTLTELGKKAYEEHSRVHIKVGDEIIALLDEDERRMMLRLYEKIVEWSRQQKKNQPSVCNKGS